MLQLQTTLRTIYQHRWLWLGLAVGFTVLYYVLLLVFTMVRFQEIPNYVVFHNTLHVYYLILTGTPSLADAIPILMDEPWFETGYKNPNFYGVATWSYMLIPPKVLLVLLMGMLLATFFVLKLHIRRSGCALRKRDKNAGKVGVVAGVGTTFVSLTSATLTWVVCCATPSWSVALAMLGMSASLALWLEPIGKLLTIAGLGLLLSAIIYETRYLMQANRLQFSH